jgi:ABC-type methionine transport system ATPase subunit
MNDLKHDYTIVIATHNMQQAARVCDWAAFFTVLEEGDPGRLVEFDRTDTIFTHPARRVLVELDEVIDRANLRTVRYVLTLGATLAQHEWSIRMLLVPRSLERIGGNAVDIGEQTA